MKPIKMFLEKLCGLDHVTVECNSDTDAQDITTRLFICLRENDFIANPVGRTKLYTPGLTIEELQAIVDKYFNPDLIDVLIN